MLTLGQVADELGHRLIKLFLRDGNGRRPVFGGYEKFQTDPHFKDNILFHEYFHGDNGARLRRVASDRLDRTGGEPDQPARADTVGDCGERAPDHGETGLARTGSSVKGIRCGA